MGTHVRICFGWSSCMLLFIDPSWDHQPTVSHGARTDPQTFAATILFDRIDEQGSTALRPAQLQSLHPRSGLNGALAWSPRSSRHLIAGSVAAVAAATTQPCCVSDSSSDQLRKIQVVEDEGLDEDA